MPDWVHSIAPPLNTLLILGLAFLVLYTSIRQLRNRSMPTAADIDKHLERIASAERTAAAAAANEARLRREMERSIDGVTQELRHIAQRVEDLVADRATLAEVDQRTVTLEQLYNSLNATVINIDKHVSGLACAGHSPSCPYSSSASPSQDGET